MKYKYTVLLDLEMWDVLTFHVVYGYVQMSGIWKKLKQILSEV